MTRIRWYIQTWIRLMARPILFYTKMPAGEWWEESLSFGAINGGIFSLGLTITIFITQYIGLLATLLEGLSTPKIIIVSPVILTIALVFFIMTYLILSGIIIGFFLLAFYVLAAVHHLTSKLVGGKGNFFQMVKGYYYSLGILPVGLILTLLAILTKFQVLSFSNLVVGENIIYYASALYVYGLWSIVGKKVYNIPRWKAFLTALVPIILVILVNIGFNRVLFPRLERWLI